MKIKIRRRRVKDETIVEVTTRVNGVRYSAPSVKELILEVFNSEATNKASRKNEH